MAKLLLYLQEGERMKIKPIPDGTGDFRYVKLKLTPHCVLHGAMNKVSSSGLWRCLRAEPTGKYKRDGVKRDCRAGCEQV